MSCAVTRTLSPERTTDPSTTASTPIEILSKANTATDAREHGRQQALHHRRTRGRHVLRRRHGFDGRDRCERREPLGRARELDPRLIEPLSAEALIHLTYYNDTATARALLEEANATGYEIKFFYSTDDPLSVSAKDQLVKGLEAGGFTATPIASTAYAEHVGS